MKAGCLGALLGGVAGCLVGASITAPHLSKGMSDPGFVIAPWMFLGAIAGLVVGVVVHSVRSRTNGSKPPEA
jgi:presenilin-like A22 family membrane protease